jgi:hypothetical protein
MNFIFGHWETDTVSLTQYLEFRKRQPSRRLGGRLNTSADNVTTSTPPVEYRYSFNGSPEALKALISGYWVVRRTAKPISVHESKLTTDIQLFCQLLALYSFFEADANEAAARAFSYATFDVSFRHKRTETKWVPGTMACCKYRDVVWNTGTEVCCV